MNDLGIGVAQLFREENRRLAGASAGNENEKMVPEGLFPGEAIVVDHGEPVEPGPDEARFFLRGIAGRIWQRLVLIADLRDVSIRLHGVTMMA